MTYFIYLCEFYSIGSKLWSKNILR